MKTMIHGLLLAGLAIVLSGCVVDPYGNVVPSAPYYYGTPYYYGSPYYYGAPYYLYGGRVYYHHHHHDYDYDHRVVAPRIAPRLAPSVRLEHGVAPGVHQVAPLHHPNAVMHSPSVGVPPSIRRSFR